MKIPGLKKRISVFWKSIASFTALIMILYTLMVLTNIQRQNEVKKEIAESTKLKIEFYLASLEKDIFDLIRMQSAFVGDEELSVLRNMGTLEDDVMAYKHLNSLRDKLKDLVNMNSYVDSASIYLTRMQKRISDTSIRNYEPDEEIILKGLRQKYTLPFLTLEGNTYIIITSEFFDFSKDAVLPDFIVCTRVSKPKIESFLKKVSGTESSKAIILGESSGLNLTGTADSRMVEDLSEIMRGFENTADTQTVSLGEPPSRHYLSYAVSRSLKSSLMVYTPEVKFYESLSGYSLWIWFFTLLTAVIILSYALWMRNMLQKPMRKLIKTFEKVEKGDLDVSVSYSSSDEFGYLYGKFNSMFNTLKSLIKELYEQKLLIQKAELKQLQYQINPHFLYNSLLILYNLIRMSDLDSAMSMSKHLGNFYQYITRSGSEEVPLAKELWHAKDYIAIQSVRFSNRLTVEFDEITENLNYIIVPRLIVQPLLENAFNHGCREKVKDGLIRIKILQSEGVVSISVEDNGDSLDDEKLQRLQASLEYPDCNPEITGILNVHKRLRIKYGNESGLFVSRGELGGLKVEIRIITGEGEAGAATIDCG